MTRDVKAPAVERYVYGLIRASEPRDFGCIGLEQEGRPGLVYTLHDGQVAAVVSEYSAGERILPLRKNIEPHQRVIREVMKTGTIIPMTFGQVAKRGIVKALKKNHDEILAELDRLDGKVEMTLKVRWDVDNIFEHFIATHPDLLALRNEVFGRAEPPTHAEKIALGRAFEERLETEREQYSERVLEALGQHAVEVKTNPPRDEKMIVDVAFLIDRGGVDAFGEKVSEVASAFPAQCVFNYSGPWAPFSFVELELDLATRAA